MNKQTNTEIDYEDMDDLQLSERIEWNEISDNEIIPDDLEIESNDYNASFGSLNFNQEGDWS
jgi:hypothetical protein